MNKNFTYYGGGHLCNNGAFFSIDGEYIICASSFAISVYSFATGRRVAEMCDSIKNFHINPRIPSQIFALLSNNIIINWDFILNEIIHFKKLYAKTTHDIIVPRLSNYLYVVLTYEKKSTKTNIVRRLSLENLKKDKLSYDSEISNEYKCHISSDAKGNVIIVYTTTLISVIKDGKTLICDYDNLKHGIISKICVQHSGEKMAISHASGYINIVPLESIVEKNGLNINKGMVKYHWHVHSTVAMIFSLDDAYLHSVGPEGVMVTWNLSNYSKTFISSLPFYLKTIDICTACPNLFLITAGDNGFQVLNNHTFDRPLTEFGLMNIPSEIKNYKNPNSYCFEPNSGHFVIPVNNGMLQIYDLVNDKTITHLKIIRRTPIYNFRQDCCDKKQDVYDTSGPKVLLIAFNRTGSGFATVTLINWFGDDNYIPKLEFWSYNHNEQKIELDNEVYDTTKKSITCLCASPSDDLYATCVDMSKCQLWSKSKSYNWECVLTINKQDKNMKQCTFSCDGTLLAVTYVSYIGCYCVYSRQYLDDLMLPPEHKDCVLDNIHCSSNKRLIIGSCLENNSFVAVWNIEYKVIQWYIDISITQLAYDIESNTLAALMKKSNQIHSQYEYSYEIININIENGKYYTKYKNIPNNVILLKFIPTSCKLYTLGRFKRKNNSYYYAPLLIVDDNQRYAILTDAGNLRRELMNKLSIMHTLPSPLEMALKSVKKEDEEIQAIKRHKKDVLDIPKMEFSEFKKMPSHALPDMSYIYYQMFNSSYTKF